MKALNSLWYFAYRCVPHTDLRFARASNDAAGFFVLRDTAREFWAFLGQVASKGIGGFEVTDTQGDPGFWLSVGDLDQLASELGGFRKI